MMNKKDDCVHVRVFRPAEGKGPVKVTTQILYSCSKLAEVDWLSSSTLFKPDPPRKAAQSSTSKIPSDISSTEQRVYPASRVKYRTQMIFKCIQICSWKMVSG